MDHASLEECQIESGATLKLILNLKGGPINTRRIPMPQPQQEQQSSSSSESSARPAAAADNSGQRPQERHLSENIQSLMTKYGKQLVDDIPKNKQVIKDS